MSRRFRHLLLVMSLLLSASIATADTVVLIHGLGLGAWSMRRLERTLAADGYRVVNLDYDSRRTPLETLTGTWLPAQLETHGIDLTAADVPPVHFVTHSMGGIILRGWLAGQPSPPPALRRVVMLAPPNHGTRLVDRLGSWFAFRVFTGVNGRRLGTGPDAYPASLPPIWPAGPELGIIAGDRPLNPWLAAVTGGPGDGKVTVASTRLEGMQAHRVMPHSHTWIEYRRPVIEEVRTFLRTGRFSAP